MSRTPVYKRFVYGASFPPREMYKSIKVGVLLISGSEVSLGICFDSRKD